MELRRIFNEGRYYDRLLAGELVARTESERVPRPEAKQPAGTISRMVWYSEPSGERVALVHQYVLPNLSLGGSGLPDPKRLLLEDEVVFC